MAGCAVTSPTVEGMGANTNSNHCTHSLFSDTSHGFCFCDITKLALVFPKNDFAVCGGKKSVASTMAHINDHLWVAAKPPSLSPSPGTLVSVSLIYKEKVLGGQTRPYSATRGCRLRRIPRHSLTEIGGDVLGHLQCVPLGSEFPPNIMLHINRA